MNLLSTANLFNNINIRLIAIKTTHFTKNCGALALNIFGLENFQFPERLETVNIWTKFHLFYAYLKRFVDLSSGYAVS